MGDQKEWVSSPVWWYQDWKCGKEIASETRKHGKSEHYVEEEKISARMAAQASSPVGWGSIKSKTYNSGRKKWKKFN